MAALAPGGCYAGGSVGEVMALTGWHGRRVLYLGDHLFADLVEARRGQHNWLTGAAAGLYIDRYASSEGINQRAGNNQNWYVYHFGWYIPLL